MAWRSPASEVNLGAIDETGVHAHESNRCPLLNLLVYSSLVSVASVRSSFSDRGPRCCPKNWSLCLPRVFDGGAGEKKKLWVQGLLSVVIMDAYFHVPHNDGGHYHNYDRVPSDFK